MSNNDWHIDEWGRRQQGLKTPRTLLEEHRDRLDAEIDHMKFKELPMLKGDGFIVIDVKNPRFSGQEHKEMSDAEEEAQDIAYASGRAIIYAPVSVIRPKRDVIAAQPSELLKQIALQPAALPAGQAVKIDTPQ